MRIGSSIGLIAVGLILALAVNLNLGGLDINLIGWILVVAGVVGLVVSLAMARQARPVVAREAYPPVAREGYPPATGEAYPPPHTHDPRI